MFEQNAFKIRLSQGEFKSIFKNKIQPQIPFQSQNWKFNFFLKLRVLAWSKVLIRFRHISWKLGYGESDRVVCACAFDSHDPSSNPDDVYNFDCLNIAQKDRK